MSEMVIMCGPAGSGKSTWVREHLPGHTVVSFDRVAWERGWRAIPPAQEGERIDAELERRARAALAAGHDIAVDLASPTRAARDRWRALATQAGATPRLVLVRTPLQVSARRAAARTPGPDSVPVDAQTVREFYAGFEWPDPDEHATIVHG